MGDMWTRERIKLLRKTYGEKQEQFRKRLRVSLIALQKWEQGKGRPSGPIEELLDRLQEDIDRGQKRALPETSPQQDCLSPDELTIQEPAPTCG